VVVIEHAVGRLVDQLFGEKSQDLSAFLQDFIHAIGAVVRPELDERDLRTAVARSSI
jgi:hypothetical protein